MSAFLYFKIFESIVSVSYTHLPAAIASDVEPGSGLASADAQAFTVDYVIAFRSLAYAFACFTGRGV